MNYGSAGARFAAFLIDLAIIWIVGFVLGFVLGMTTDQQTAAGVGSLLQIVIGVGYWVVYQQKMTQTIGKKVMHLKVVDSTGKTPGVMTFFLREIIGKFVSSIILMIGFLMILWDSKKQGLHDKIANTFVVKV
ncbi:hypothetical protein A2617_04735 [Candidatus Daviesbacteria bacterium RIFOXYD1_FULL_41_10]|uniref:RDD domain-containing protein n=3 Tax=Patescibacteria group TaxID=1783273 RepID=A0A1F5N1V5_9BACT|nr:MAG: RDD domain protein [Candidatus Daviesbacteria bacterium GW2011_GWB1_41_5]KKT81597.1 MAG: RDD domain protein [Candidatus Azambacteria bacterium GW2011_GWA1_44_9]OGE71563.1 MAG: hypothetical protein A2617_04735 [Candidatus Daviesbacteria bacterium RIFOXYD1_FULL_41_10]